MTCIVHYLRLDQTDPKGVHHDISRLTDLSPFAFARALTRCDFILLHE